MEIAVRSYGNSCEILWKKLLRSYKNLIRSMVSCKVLMYKIIEMVTCARSYENPYENLGTFLVRCTCTISYIPSIRANSISHRPT